jgi:hypothetical protein
MRKGPDYNYSKHSIQRQELFIFRQHLGPLLVFLGVRVADLLSPCVVFLRHVSRVPNVVSVLCPMLPASCVPNVASVLCTQFCQCLVYQILPVSCIHNVASVLCPMLPVSCVSNVASVLCAQFCQCLVYPMLPVSCVPNVASVLCTQCCQCLCVFLLAWLPLRFFLTFVKNSTNLQIEINTCHSLGRFQLARCTWYNIIW